MTDHQLAREDGHESVVDVLNLFNLRPAWQTRALCHGRTREFFHTPADQTAASHEANIRARYCSRCSVERECSQAKKDNAGIWGEGVTRTKRTESTWPDETPEQIIERTRREQGDEVADIVAKALGMTPKRKRQVPERVGTKEPKARPAIPRIKTGLTREEVRERYGAEWSLRTKRNAGLPGHGKTGLPNSGAARSKKGGKSA